MKTTKILKEILIALIAIAPLAYFLFIWGSLPTEIPVHFDGAGNPDSFGGRGTIVRTLSFICIGTYLFLLYIPRIDPKNNFKLYSDTYAKLRLIISIFFSAIGFIIISSVVTQKLDTTLFYIAIAGLFSLMGNYFSVIRPNYFLGLRTPWTLESETNWKKTHFYTGRLWFFGGILLIAMLLLSPSAYNLYIYLGVLAILGVFPVAYSFILFKKDQKSNNGDGTTPPKPKPAGPPMLSQSECWYYSFYINPNDSRIFVPKRCKMTGWTINFGNPYSYIVIAAIIGIIIGTQYLN
ncbi:DUF1648 domain-containing protein [Puteibacter caeruleilacunae]|nr:DUF1648 domain-containing protein [Puteibacter caeruleilacunae]